MKLAKHVEILHPWGMRTRKRYEPGLAAALEAAGGPTALSKHLKIEPSAITQWSRIPAERVRAVETATGIPRHVLRPDLFEQPQDAA